MIQSLLIANRGEIACRIIRTARAMGIRTVAVYSDADAKALHVRQADEAVHIGASPAAESYLRGDKIIAAALASGAEAIHPGYGFLSENAGFAQSVIDAGLIWVGPAPASITAMGLKDAAKQLMTAAGVPVTPGYMGADQAPALLAAEAGKIGYPVLIKAVAGGGGKGMRLVENAADFAEALASCQREAAASFGNAHVLIEKYIQRPRHIEVQVFGDTHGNIVHLFERDCSLQRRHQKVIEEAPAPGMDEVTRAALCAAAVRAARSVDYVGAGTIEFIADASEGLRADRIWFMEMNTRLQVEHPVTEEITGVDLVEWQLRVASGEPLPLRQEEITITGHAIEARLYAEDPAKGFLPSTGRLEYLFFQSCGRVETGVEEGDIISPYYDPMVAKLVARGADRDEAIGSLRQMVASAEIWPVKTNSGFLDRVLGNPAFEGGELDTGFIGRHGDELIPLDKSDDLLWGTAATFALQRARDEDEGLAGFRLNAARRFTVTLTHQGETKMLCDDLILADATGYTDDDRVLVFHRGSTFEFHKSTRGTHTATSSGAILSPMPGKVIAVEVAEGQHVTKGQRLLSLEAMKMEHAMTAPFDGVVAELGVAAGAQVQVEALLARITPHGGPA